MREEDSASDKQLGVIGWSPLSSVFVGLAIFVAPSFAVALITAFAADRQNTTIDQVLENLSATQEFGLALASAAITLTLLYLYLEKRGGLRALGFNKLTFSHLKLAAIGFALYLALFSVLFTIVEQVFVTFDEDQVQDSLIDGEESLITLGLGFIALVIIAPIVEEMLFRGFAFRGLAKGVGLWPAAFVTSALFGLAHAQFNVALDTFALGLVAAWLVWRSKSLWPAIVLHALKNLLAFSLRLLQ